MEINVSPPSKMHGDLINGLCYTAFLPVYAWLWASDPEPGAGIICLFFLTTAIFSWWSWWRGNTLASIAAGLSMSMSIAGMNHFQWPHKGEVVVLPQFLWSLVIISSNLQLCFLVKAGMALQALGMALFVAHSSPLIAGSEASPTLLGATTVHVLFHCWDLTTEGSRGDSKRELMRARLASLVLAGAFAYHVSTELFKMMHIPGYSLLGGYAILKAGFFASVGLAAAGAFRAQVDTTQMLESLVAERTREVVKQANQLRMVELALQASETAIAITDADHQIVWSNHALDSIRRLQRQEHEPVLVDSLSLSIEAKERFRVCFDKNCPNRTEITVGEGDFMVDVSPFAGNKEGLDGPGTDDPGFLVVLKDVTELRARERAEKLAVKELVQKQAMKESMETLSHELRTPLQAVMGMASLLLEKENVTVDECKDSMSIIMASSRMLLVLINNLLDLRKCDAKMMNEFQLAPLSLCTSLTESVDFCLPMGSINDVCLSLCMDEMTERSHVLLNSLRFQQIVVNLVSNAVKYTRPGSNVHISTKVLPFSEVYKSMNTALAIGLPVSHQAEGLAEDSFIAVVSVSDCGPGISEDAAGKVFSKFSQVTKQGPAVIGGNKVAQPTGTGLGLNLCVRFVERLNGNIWVSNCPDGGGSCFSFYLPVVSVGAHAEKQESNDISSIETTPGTSGPDPQNDESSASSPKISDIRVLVVDDTALNLKVLKRMLERVGVAKVQTVDSGREALCLLKEESFDLVLTDIQMPEMCGIELFEAIRRDDTISKELVVVALTAETSEALHQRCLEAGIPHVLHKPIAMAQIQNFFDEIYGGLCHTLS